MIIKIDHLSGIPVYRQIMDWIKQDIAAGHLLPDQELPSIRELAVQARVNPNTVVRAYRDLISENVVYSRQGMGYFIRERQPEPWEAIKAEMKKIIVEAKVRQVEQRDLEHSFHDAVEDIYSGGQKG